ncbi:dethiobiotin synthase [Thiospirillum jenense]|uniref:ATP-dependent dethiobiotin synthetase BioD n=1 Tax=Thiospirillum jenense TaxID=1653858 RepID=A0A839HF88_9GAMM|nr:dethiobiotin synthase [Thiospirillum jenense]
MTGRGVFITGTDTGCGKTLISLGIMAALQQRGYTVLGMKPVASGCDRDAQGGLINADARALQAQSSRPVAYSTINPFAFALPLAPPLAAAHAGRIIQPDLIRTAYAQLRNQADWVIVEGIGGWRVPLTADFAVSDLPNWLEIPVILTVGLRLGCVNHALLTAERLIADRVPLIGWIGSSVDPDMVAADETCALLTELLPRPCLGVIPHLTAPNAGAVAEYLDITPLESP